MNFMPVDSEISPGMRGCCCGEGGGRWGGAGVAILKQRTNMCSGTDRGMRKERV